VEAMKRNIKQRRHRRYHAVGVNDVLRACRDVLPEAQRQQVDWDSVMEQYGGEKEGEEIDEASDTEDAPSTKNEEDDDDDADDDDGTPASSHPNVGKSSLINSVFGRTVVSASRTPGHTKHFQTLHLSPTLRLCDGPGLVFPSLLPRALQILSGIYNVAQVQEPYTAIHFLAERVPVERVLNLKPPHHTAGDADHDYEWSAWDICEAFAIQRGFMTARGARPDVSRAANQILRMVNMGQVLLSFKPPGFYSKPGYYLKKEIDAQNESALSVD
ncbi:hypothetical protein SYNPS1DRAFT_11664, partial [Syncephalis pseudoplumigaleata]